MSLNEQARLDSGCDNATCASGPFYCPSDTTVYLDISFFNDMEQYQGHSNAGT